MSESHESATTPDTYTASPGSTQSPSVSSDQYTKRKPTRSAPTADTPATALIAIMIDVDTGRVVDVEGRDTSGSRRDLSTTEKATLVNRWGSRSVEDLLEQAFEAGIACVLDGDMEPDSTDESPDDAKLRRLLLAPLIERSGVKRLMESAVLDRAISSTLVDRSTKK